MKCSSCGNEVSVTSKYCPGCGIGLDSVPTVPLARRDTNDNPASAFQADIKPYVQSPSFPVPVQAPLAASHLGDNAYYLLINGQQSGPYTVNQMRSMWQTGAINLSTCYWQEGMPAWQPLASIRYFLETGGPGQPGQIIVNQINQPMIYPAMMMAPKSRVAYILLGLFLGYFGVHNFYAGYAGKGVAQLLITFFLGWIFGLGFFISGLWALIEIIAVNTDARGIRMS